MLKLISGRRVRHATGATIVGLIASLVLATDCSASAGQGQSQQAAGTRSAAAYAASNPIPPRLEWNENFGYCGETALISAGLYYGQYLSQYDARAIASNNKAQYKASSQLLIGGNDTSAAQSMRLNYAEWASPKGATAASFLTWVKGEVLHGYPVAIGVYTNENLFYGSTDPNAGDPDYDHIVIVTGIQSNHPLTGAVTYYPDDQITFSDHGLRTPSGKPQYLFTYSFAGFQATRQQANSPGGAVYSLADASPDYGIAITGVADKALETRPVRVTTSVNYESPEIQDGSNVRPAAMPLKLTVTVSGLNPGTTYNLYRYSSAGNVPTANFNARRSAAAQVVTFTAGSSTYTTTQNITSSDEAFYRAVPASGA